MKKELKQAVDAMNAMLTHMGMDEDEFNKVTYDQMRQAIAAGSKALAQPEQTPAAWFWLDLSEDGYEWKHMADNQADADAYLPHQVIPFYKAPPQRTWVGLEGEEIRNSWEEATKPDRSTMTMVTSFARALEAYLKQKNGYAEEKNT